MEPRHARRRPRRHAGRARTLERVDVVGHSFGGRLALELAARHPERVGRIVLLDPAVWVPPHIALERAERAREDASYASVEEAIAERLATGTGTDERARREELPQHSAARRRRPLARRASHRPRSSPRTARWRRRRRSTASRAPTLLVRGRESEVVPESLQDFVCETMSDCRVVTVPGGHIVMWDAFDETADAILGFLEDSRA